MHFRILSADTDLDELRLARGLSERLQKRVKRNTGRRREATLEIEEVDPQFEKELWL